MAVNLSPVGGVAAQFFNNNGVPLSGGKLFTYSAGTTTPAATYTSSLGVSFHTNPIVLDAAGRVPNSGEIWLTDGVIYKFVLKDSNDVLIATYDNITGINSNFVNFTAQQEIQTATSGQTVFTLTTMQYQPGTNSLTVYVDGVNQYGPGAQYAYVETSSTVVTFASGLHVGASVKFTTTIQTSGNATDAAVVSYTPPFTDSVTTNVEDKLAEVLSVLDFGADPTGATDSTTAIQNAIDAAEGGYGAYAGTGRTVYFPTGVYLCGDLEIKFTGQRLAGESKYGTWLIGKSGAECVIKVGGIDYAYPVGNPLRNTNRRETIIENLTIDYSNIDNDTESAGIRYQSSYGNSLRDVVFECTDERTKSSWALYFGEGCYTTVVESVTAKRIKIYSPTADAPTTLTFIGVDSSYVDIDNALGITFLQPIMQSRVANDYGTYRMKVVNCNSFTAIGGDWEDDNAANYMYYFDNVLGNVVSMGNATSPFQGGYAVYGASGITGKRLLQDDKTRQFEYREGTWTPVLSWSDPGTSTIVAGSRGGTYVKNGNLVTCSFYFDNATFTNGTATGSLNLTGLPFTAATTGTDVWGGTPTLQIGYPTSLQSILVTISTSTATFRKNDGTGGAIVVADVSGSGKFLRGTFTYQCVN